LRRPDGVKWARGPEEHRTRLCEPRWYAKPRLRRAGKVRGTCVYGEQRRVGEKRIAGECGKKNGPNTLLIR